MTIQELSKLSQLKHEVVLLEAQIKQCRTEFDEACTSHRIETDTVKGSSRSYPYCVHTMTVEGAAKEVSGARERTRKAYAKTLALLWDKRAEFAEEEQRLTEYILTVDDSRMRQILLLRFVNGLDWPDVAAKMGERESEDSVRKATKRFLEKF